LTSRISAAQDVFGEFVEEVPGQRASHAKRWSVLVRQLEKEATVLQDLVTPDSRTLNRNTLAFFQGI